MECHLRPPSALPFHPLSWLIHFTGVLSFMASFKYLADNPSPIADSYGSYFQYLTIIGLSLATVTFAAALLADMTHSVRLFHLKNALSICSVPLEISISILYWGIKAYNRDLIFPEGMVVLGPWADLGFHFVPSVLLSLDFFIFSPPWTVSVRGAIALSSAFAIAYWFWVERCSDHNQRYPYPLMENLSVSGRVVLFSLSAMVMMASIVALKKSHAIVSQQISRAKAAKR